LKKVREICNKNGILLIADEIQSGFCRTGKWFGIDHSEVIPDIMVFAKGIASGYPLSGIASSYDLMKTQPPGSVGGTFASNAVACAAALATVKVMKDENYNFNVSNRGKQLTEGLKRIQKKHPDFIEDVRGLGLMIGVEFDSNLKDFASKIAKQCIKDGMLILTTGAYQTIRFIPPLNVSSKEIQSALEIFESSFEKVISESKH